MRFLSVSSDLTIHIIFYQLSNTAMSRCSKPTTNQSVKSLKKTQLLLLHSLMFDLHGTEKNKPSMSEVDKFPKLLNPFFVQSAFVLKCVISFYDECLHSSSFQKKNAQMRVKSLAGAVKLSMRGKSCNIRPTLKMAVDVSRTQAVCFLASELHEDSPVEPESAVGVEPLHPRPNPESAEGPGKAPGKTLTPEKKQRVNILVFI